jgi:hypothetical protein
MLRQNLVKRQFLLGLYSILATPMNFIWLWNLDIVTRVKGKFVPVLNKAPRHEDVLDVEV